MVSKVKKISKQKQNNGSSMMSLTTRCLMLLQQIAVNQKRILDMQQELKKKDENGN
jgi:hypothetical protein